MPLPQRIALRPLYGAPNLCRAVVADEAFCAVRQQHPCDGIQLLRREGRRWCVRRGWSAGSRILAGDVGQQARRPGRHGTHGYSRHL